MLFKSQKWHKENGEKRINLFAQMFGSKIFAYSFLLTSQQSCETDIINPTFHIVGSWRAWDFCKASWGKVILSPISFWCEQLVLILSQGVQVLCVAWKTFSVDDDWKKKPSEELLPDLRTRLDLPYSFKLPINGNRWKRVLPPTVTKAPQSGVLSLFLYSLGKKLSYTAREKGLHFCAHPKPPQTI